MVKEERRKRKRGGKERDGREMPNVLNWSKRRG
jgi:hypothetical protein